MRRFQTIVLLLALFSGQVFMKVITPFEDYIHQNLKRSVCESYCKGQQQACLNSNSCLLNSENCYSLCKQVYDDCKATNWRCKNNG